MKYDSMGERMKEYEARADYALSPASRWVMRLDGNGFSKFMKKIGAQKPFDARVMRIMTEVSKALAVRFNFVTVYTQSDEITCIPNLRPENETGEPLFNLRIQKLCSLVASYASVVFYREFIKDFPEYGELAPIFDARMFSVDCEAEVYNAVLWRQRDCQKNAKNLVGQQFFSFKELQGLTSDQQVEKVLLEKGVSFESYPEEFRNGIFVKRRQKEVDGLNPITGEYETAMRSVVEVFTLELSRPADTLDWVLRKYA